MCQMWLMEFCNRVFVVSSALLRSRQMPALCVLDTQNCKTMVLHWPRKHKFPPFFWGCLFVCWERKGSSSGRVWVGLGCFYRNSTHPRPSCSHLKAGTYTGRRTHASKLTTKGTMGDSPRQRCLLKADLSQGNNSLRLLWLQSVWGSLSLCFINQLKKQHLPVWCGALGA